MVCTVIFMSNPTVVLCWGWGFDKNPTVVLCCVGVGVLTIVSDYFKLGNLRLYFGVPNEIWDRSHR